MGANFIALRQSPDKARGNEKKGNAVADVFVSYARADFERAKTLVEAMRAEGFQVWWDQDVAANAPWDLTIEAELKQAKSVIVLWSKASSASENVRAEARWARREGRLLQAFLEKCEPPFFFGERQGADLSKWGGARDADRFVMLSAGVRDLVAGRKPKVGLGFKPKEKRTGLFVLGGLGALAVAGAAAAAVLWIPEVRERVFPKPPVVWAMGLGANVDMRPAAAPEIVFPERLGSRVLVSMSSKFTADDVRGEEMIVSRQTVQLRVPGAQPVPFAWLWFSDKDGEGGYHERTGDAGPFAITDAGFREIVFQPIDVFTWADFAALMEDAETRGVSFADFVLTAEVQTDGAAKTLEATCRIPITGIMNRVRNDGLSLSPIILSCGAPAPARDDGEELPPLETPPAEAAAPKNEAATPQSPIPTP